MEETEMRLYLPSFLHFLLFMVSVMLVVEILVYSCIYGLSALTFIISIAAGFLVGIVTIILDESTIIQGHEFFGSVMAAFVIITNVLFIIYGGSEFQILNSMILFAMMVITVSLLYITIISHFLNKGGAQYEK